MQNGQQKAELSLPKRQDVGLPPIALKISHNPTQQSCRRRTSPVTFSPYRARRCEIIGRKPQYTKVAHWSSTTYDGEFWPFSIFSHLLSVSRGGVRRPSGAAAYNLGATMEFRCALPVVDCCARGRAHAAASSEALHALGQTACGRAGVLRW